MMTDNNPDTVLPEKQLITIRFEDILAFIKVHFLTLIVIAFISGIFGYALSYLFTIKYQAKVTVLPEYGGSKRGAGSLALLAGINSEGAEKLTPDLYPTILNSTIFGKYLLSQPVVNQKNKSYANLKNYLSRDTTQSFISRLFGSSDKKEKKLLVKLPDPNILSINADEYSLIKIATKLITLSVDQKAGVLTITADTDDPVVSSILVEASKKYLIDYVEDYRTGKAKQQAEILRDQAAAAKLRMKKTEYSLQAYRDRNRGVFTNLARIDEQTLQSDYMLSESLYSDLTRRYEQALLKVKEEKPVFKVLEPTNIPLVKSSPKRVRFFLITAVLGGIIAIGCILLFRKDLLKPIFSLKRNSI